MFMYEGIRWFNNLDSPIPTDAVSRAGLGCGGYSASPAQCDCVWIIPAWLITDRGAGSAAGMGQQAV